MRLANPEYLYLLLLFPFLTGYLIFFRHLDFPGFRFSSLRKMKGIEGGMHFLRMNVLTVGFLRLTALFFMIIALARPQRGLKTEELSTKATDIMVCFDVSRSMLSIDFKPQNRFEVARQVLLDFIKGREHDRLGLVLFAEHAITQCPLTIDRAALSNLLQMIEIGVIPPDQTAIGVGLATAVNRLKNSNAKSKVIILVTDGANNAGSVDPITAAKTASAFKIKIYSIGAGSPEGGLMPVNDPIMGQRLVQFKSDLDEDMLLRIASETGGKYFRAKNPDALKTIFKEIDSLEKTDINIKQYVDYEEMYIWFLVLAVLLIFIELVATKTYFRTLP